MTNPTLFSELEARDKAISQVMGNAGDDWRDEAYRVFRDMPSIMTGEDFRVACIENGVKPHHHNAWGGIVAGLVRSGYLQDTGRTTTMKSPGSHARKTTVYRKAELYGDF